ncbi:aminofutalosine synthase MqnE [Desulfobaculum bizertense]|uniref:Aminodeoxyfutalosine synthase n=1 Tax=Desulfobaculum bizertense DSM 18034 TaxID=1121442 RepID=A0A1T4WIX1_9BACT|nr:aminofutalosine synthase MqnE [Desulfobaculum bizertense]UIJ37148.1 aminofutalosine synthase MqnE [Desulfobaculum bizertense]SKA77306.1 aminodeoxyfutalosine synthase [Desulfobaculum bizertense DSM 18034]
MQKYIDKVRNGERLSIEGALELAKNCDIHTLGELGKEAREKRFGNKAFWVYNQHLNFTNVCANACRFCAFYKRAGADGSYTYSIDDVRERIRSRAHEPIREIHIVGGLNPDLPYSYYMDLIAAIREERPNVAIKAFTAVEIAHLAQHMGKSHKEILTDMRAAGLDALPGGGAEVFSPKLREKLCPEKLSGEEWLKIHETAHGMGIPTNCTLLFGHIETWEDRLEHMAALRELQDRTGGFKVFIPLQYQPKNNPLESQGTDGQDYLRMIAIARIFMDNIDHLKAYWAFSGIKAAQMALHAGADDFDGTLVEEKVGHAAGASSPTGMTVAKLEEHIRQAGFTPVERDTFFEEVHA